MACAEDIRRDWHARLEADGINQPPDATPSIVKWLLGEDITRFDGLSSKDLKVAQRAMDYRYRILRQRYLAVHPDQAYRNLLQRLSGLFLIRSKIKTWVALSRDRRRTVMEVLQEVVQELLQSDRHIQAQMRWIAQCTPHTRLRNALVLTSIEEYCLRPIRNQPLLVYRFMNYLRRSQRGGMTQVPTGDLIRLVSEEISPDESDSPISLLDTQAMDHYQEQQFWDEQHALRLQVQESFVAYLQEKVDPVAAQWLELYLQGKPQEAIAQTLDLPIKKIYRLREKISYHAINVFTLKSHTDLVTAWLNTSLLDHNLGLTPQQWQQYWQELSPKQQTLLQQLKAGQSIEAIAQDQSLKVNQVLGEWCKLYLLAQALRGA